MNWRQLSNVAVTALLRSPLHQLVSDSVLLITLTGRRSGRAVSIPVNYVREPETGDLLVISLRSRNWWRNLRGTAPVNLLVRGQHLEARGEAVERADEVLAGMLIFIRQNPSYGKQAGIKLDSHGNPSEPGQLERLVRNRVLVRLVTVERATTRARRPADAKHEALTAGTARSTG